MNLKPIRIICIPKQLWTSLLCLCAAAAMFIAVNGVPRAVRTGAVQRQLPIYSVERDQKMASLSFDAAWGNVRMRPGDTKGLRVRVLNMKKKRTVPMPERSFFRNNITSL